MTRHSKVSSEQCTEPAATDDPLCSCLAASPFAPPSVLSLSRRHPPPDLTWLPISREGIGYFMLPATRSSASPPALDARAAPRPPSLHVQPIAHPPSLHELPPTCPVQSLDKLTATPPSRRTHWAPTLLPSGASCITVGRPDEVAPGPPAEHAHDWRAAVHSQLLLFALPRGTASGPPHMHVQLLKPPAAKGHGGWARPYAV